jgi:hypothetical protein
MLSRVMRNFAAAAPSHLNISENFVAINGMKFLDRNSVISVIILQTVYL